MGKAIRWLKGLFGMNRDRETNKATNQNQSQSQSQSRSSNELRDKKGSSFGRPATESSDGICNNPATIPPNLSAAEAAWLRSYYSQTEQEQSKHAIAVAAATAAAADAAVAAAQAAVAVVRLTSHGRGTMFGGHERWASVKIQTVFRGYLARKALRALRGLVKLQAVVRGYLVRKQATATLYSMQALIRAQASVRSLKNTRSLFLTNNNNRSLDPKPRKSMDNRFDHDSSSNTNNSADHYYRAPTHSRRLSASTEANFADDSPKIVEIDTGRPKSRSSRRTNASVSDAGDVPSSPAAAPPCRRISIPDSHHYYNNNNNYSSSSDWGLAGDECRFSTAQSTPRFCGECGSAAAAAPPTPAKSVCGEFPNYMSSTKSFKAKLRSYSAPKQRPEPGTGPKKRLSLTDLMESSRVSLSGVRMRRSCSQVQEAVTFKNAIMSNLQSSGSRDNVD